MLMGADPIEFGRSFQAPISLGQRLELVQFKIAFQGPVHPDSGMIINLVEVDQWIQEFQAELKNQKWNLSSRVFLFAKQFFQGKSVAAIQFSFFQMEVAGRQASWRPSFGKNEVHFTVRKKFYVPSLKDKNLKKKIQAQITFEGELQQKFKVPSFQQLQKMYQDFGQGKNSNWPHVKKIFWQDPELPTIVSSIF